MIRVATILLAAIVALQGIQCRSIALSREIRSSSDDQSTNFEKNMPKPEKKALLSNPVSVLGEIWKYCEIKLLSTFNNFIRSKILFKNAFNCHLFLSGRTISTGTKFA